MRPRRLLHGLMLCALRPDTELKLLPVFLPQHRARLILLLMLHGLGPAKKLRLVHVSRVHMPHHAERGVREAAANQCAERRVPAREPARVVVGVVMA